MSLQRVEPYRRSDRCVTCGYPESKHLDGVCPSRIDSKTRFGTMNLPEGMTCADCKHLKHPCATIFGRIAADESCDWYPIRFVAKESV